MVEIELKAFKTLLFLPILSFCFELDIKNELFKCSEIKAYPSRLMCFDTLVANIKPEDKQELRAKALIRECSHCHGGRWEIKTIPEHPPVRDLSAKTIEKTLLAYKYKKKKSTTMYFQTRELKDEDFKIIGDYIRKKVDSENF